MPTFSYEAENREGTIVAGALHAVNLVNAVEHLRMRGHFPVSVVPEKKKSVRKVTLKGLFLFLSGSRPQKHDVSRFYRNLARLLGAGVPLPLSLSLSAERQKGGRLKKVLDKMASDVRSGASFATALAKHPKIFSNACVTIAQVAEKNGTEAEMLNRLADWNERNEAVLNTLGATARRPVTFLVVGFLLTFYSFMMLLAFIECLGYYIVRPFGFLYNIVNVIGAIILHRLELIFLIPLIGVMLLSMLSLGSRFKFLGAVPHQILFRLPLIGRAAKNACLAQFAGTFGNLIGAGIPLSQAFDTASESPFSRSVAKRLARLSERIRKGIPLAQVLAETSLFPPTSLSMVAAGEQTGTLAPAMLRVADFHEAELHRRPKGALRMFLLGAGLIIALFLILYLLQYAAPQCVGGT